MEFLCLSIFFLLHMHVQFYFNFLPVTHASIQNLDCKAHIQFGISSQSFWTFVVILLIIWCSLSGGGGGNCKQLFCFSIEESHKWLLVEEVASKLAVWSSLFIGLCLPMFWDCQANDTDQSCKEAVSALCIQPQLCVALEPALCIQPQLCVKLEPALCIQPQLCVKLEPALCIQPQLCVKLEPTLCIQPQLCVKLEPSLHCVVILTVLFWLLCL